MWVHRSFIPSDFLLPFCIVIVPLCIVITELRRCGIVAIYDRCTFRSPRERLLVCYNWGCIDVVLTHGSLSSQWFLWPIHIQIVMIGLLDFVHHAYLNHISMAIDIVMYITHFWLEWLNLEEPPTFMKSTLWLAEIQHWNPTPNSTPHTDFGRLILVVV